MLSLALATRAQSARLDGGEDGLDHFAERGRVGGVHAAAHRKHLVRLVDGAVRVCVWVLCVVVMIMVEVGKSAAGMEKKNKKRYEGNK